MFAVYLVSSLWSMICALVLVWRTLVHTLSLFLVHAAVPLDISLAPTRLMSNSLWFLLVLSYRLSMLLMKQPSICTTWRRNLLITLGAHRPGGGTFKTYDNTACGQELLDAFEDGQFKKTDIALQFSIDGAQLC
jgi:hypothetical protein